MESPSPQSGEVNKAAGSPRGDAKGPSDDLLRFEDHADVMGSTFSIIVYGADRANMEAAVDAAFEEVQRLDQMLSNYLPSSEWSEINRSVAHRVVGVSPELFRLLSDCVEYSRQSEGAFDITVGRLMKVWGFYKGTGRLPLPGEVNAALASVGSHHVRLDPARLTVQFDHAEVELDPGGIGKGYAIDRMVDILKQRGMTSALLAGSASTIYGLGSPPGEPRGWRVSVGNPRSPRQAATEVFLKNSALSTTAGYERFFRAQGRAYSHILDPRTGYPAQGTSLVSVLARRAIDSEAWTKPYFIHGRAWTAEHKPAEFSVFFYDDTQEPACGWL
jgi:thiamine biosynthesis lipoprotein